MTSPLPSIDEAHAAQFDRALKEHGGAIGAALADLEIEDVPIELHVTWEAMLKGVEYLRFLEHEVDRWMGPYRLRWDREQIVHDDPVLAAQIREGIAEAERGETVHLGSFAQYLEEEKD